MTPAEESHLCACEALALAEAGVYSMEDLLATLRCIRNTLASDMKPSRIAENERKVLHLNI